MTDYYYAPTNPPDNPGDLPRWLATEFNDLRRIINLLIAGHVDVSHVAPAKPRQGDIRYADGTNWNPGIGPGLYCYNGTAWVDLSGVQTITLTGDVTGSGTGTFPATISNNAVTNAKSAQMGANTIKGNNIGSTANASDLTTSQATAMLEVFTSLLKGVVPASGGGTTNFLRADGSWTAPSGGTLITSGSATLDFLSGSVDSSVAVTGQTGILSGSRVLAWISPAATADNTIDDHIFEEFEQPIACNIVAGTGFTIYLKCKNGLAFGKYNISWAWF